MSGTSRPDHDDRVLPTSRWLAAGVAPFLVVAFVVLFPWPTSTDRWFAWTIRPTMTPMVLGSAYIGGAYFFVRVWRASRWHTVAAGFVPVAVFASCLGVATIVHWEKFDHDHVAFWIWAGLYFTTPFLVVAAFVRNQRLRASPTADEPVLPTTARVASGATGLAAGVFGAYVFLRPERAIDFWPWELTPLTARVIGSILLLGLSGLLIAADPRWSAAQIMVQVAQIMIALFLVAAVRARDELDTGRPMTWMLGVGLGTVLAGTLLLEVRMRGIGRAGRSPAPAPH